MMDKETAAAEPVEDNLVDEVVERSTDRADVSGAALLDESGCLNLDKRGAKPLSRIFTEQEERKAAAVASKPLCGEWDKTFVAPRRCAAIADRLTSKGTLIRTSTHSCRLKATESERRSAGRS
jgi:hypothetical protein